MGSKLEVGGSGSYWFVGASYKGGTEDQTSRSYRRGDGVLFSPGERRSVGGESQSRRD